MLAAPSILCVFLLTCFDKTEVDEANGCPTKCQCYSAPKEGYKWQDTSYSVICDINDKLEDKQLASLASFPSINTLALGITGPISIPSHEFIHEQLKLTHLYLEDTQPIGKTIIALKVLPNLHLNSLVLKYITFNQINLNQFDWTLVPSALSGLHIQHCLLDKLTKSNFGTLGGRGAIKTLSIVSNKDSPLTQIHNIDNDVFEDWITLRMLTIVKSKIKNMEWVTTNMEELWYLDLSDNFIETIPNHIFDLPKLKELNLDQNNFKTITWNQLLPGLSKLTTFSINGNILCFNQDAVDLYEQYSQYSNDKTSLMPKFLDESLAKKSCQIMPDNEQQLLDQNIMKIKSSSCNKLTKDQLINPHLCSKWQGSKAYQDEY